MAKSGWQPHHNIICCCFLQLLKDWKSLRRAFKKLDSSHRGYLSMEDFQRAVMQCGLKVNAEDLYHIFAHFDSNLDGKVTYEEFTAHMLDTAEWWCGVNCYIGQGCWESAGSVLIKAWCMDSEATARKMSDFTIYIIIHTLRMDLLKFGPGSPLLSQVADHM